VSLVPNGADTSMFDPSQDGAAFRTLHGLDGKFTVLYAGAHGVSNDLGVIVAAADLLREQRNIHFVFLGDGKEKASLQARAAQLGLENITFLPSVPKQQVPEILAATDACIAILKPLEMYKTTYPNKVFDYMAAARPVVLAIDGVVREVVEAAGCGVFAQPGNPQALAAAVQALAADTARARRMGAAGRAYVEAHFDRAHLALQMALVMEEMRQAHE
jgi:glycosyltransferase involved in cell wall biosynthesis